MKTAYSSGKKAFRNLADFVRIVLVISDGAQLITGAQTDVAPAPDKDALPKVQSGPGDGAQIARASAIRRVLDAPRHKNR